MQQYYDAQTARDPDKALGFWSMNANPRMSREGFVAVFGAGDAQYSVEIQSVKITGNDARLRVAVTIARTIVRNDVPGVSRQMLLNAAALAEGRDVVEALSRRAGRRRLRGPAAGDRPPPTARG